MSHNDLFVAMHKLGYRKEYYRFDIIVPRKMLGKGRTFPIYSNERAPKGTSWTREDCKFPIKETLGVCLVSTANGEARIGVILNPGRLMEFAKALWDAVQEYGGEFTLIEFEGNGETE